MKSGSEMTHSEFVEYTKAYASLFESETVSLMRFERDENLLSIPFCICYERLLEDRLRYCMTCSEYYRAMAEKIFWFMKPLVLRRVRKFESLHYEALGRLIQVRSYRKVQYGEEKGFSD